MDKQIPVAQLPFRFGAAVKKEYGAIHYAEELGPGVYYIATLPPQGHYFGGECLVVTADSPIISDRARTFGTPLPTNPITYIYSHNDYFDKGRWVVEYELHKYCLEHGIPLPQGGSLREDIARGMETCPEYFGEFPIPMETPWGAPIQADKVGNGVFWLRTEQEGWVLTIAYPICEDISEYVLEHAVLLPEDREKGIDNTCGFRFFRKQDSCLPLLELIEFTNPDWAGKFSMPAIKNAVLQFFPDYARNYENIATMEERIGFDADAGTEFYRFPVGEMK